MATKKNKRSPRNSTGKVKSTKNPAKLKDDPDQQSNNPSSESVPVAPVTSTSTSTSSTINTADIIVEGTAIAAESSSTTKPVVASATQINDSDDRSMFAKSMNESQSTAEKGQEKKPEKEPEKEQEMEQEKQQEKQQEKEQEKEKELEKELEKEPEKEQENDDDNAIGSQVNSASSTSAKAALDVDVNDNDVTESISFEANKGVRDSVDLLDSMIVNEKSVLPVTARQSEASGVAATGANEAQAQVISGEEDTIDDSAETSGTCKVDDSTAAASVNNEVAMKKTGEEMEMEKMVRLEWQHTKASKVAVAGSFNGWDSNVQMQRGGDDSFFLDVRLPHGKHLYKFVVDGQWHYDILKPNEVDNDANVNNMLFV